MTRLNLSLVSSAVIKMEVVSILGTKMEGHMGKEIFTLISERNSSLRKLNVTYNNLSMVDSSILARAVSKQEEVDLTGTNLTLKQGEAILTVMCVKSCKVKTLYI